AVSLLQPERHDHVLSTPNKLWESLAAGVPVVVSDYPVMRGIVLDPSNGPLGAVCNATHPGSIANAVLEIVSCSPRERARLRARCLAAAHRRWNWETEAARLVALYGEIAEARNGHSVVARAA